MAGSSDGSKIFSWIESSLYIARHFCLNKIWSTYLLQIILEYRYSTIHRVHSWFLTFRTSEEIDRIVSAEIPYTPVYKFWTKIIQNNQTFDDSWFMWCNESITIHGQWSSFRTKNYPKEFRELISMKMNIQVIVEEIMDEQ